MQFKDANEYRSHLQQIIPDYRIVEQAVARRFPTTLPRPVSLRELAERKYPKPSADDQDWVDTAPSDKAHKSMMTAGNESFIRRLLPAKLEFLKRYQARG